MQQRVDAALVRDDAAHGRDGTGVGEVLLDWLTAGAGDGIDTDESAERRHLGEAVAVLAHGLIALGVRKGDPIAVLSEPWPERSVVELAAASIGAVLCDAGAGASAEEIGARLAGAKVLVARDHESVRAVLAAGMPFTDLERIIVRDGDVALAAVDERIAGFAEVMDAGRVHRRANPSQLEAFVRAVRPQDAAMLVLRPGRDAAACGLITHRELAAAIARHVRAARIRNVSVEHVLTHLPLLQLIASAPPAHLTLVTDADVPSEAVVMQPVIEASRSQASPPCNAASTRPRGERPWGYFESLDAGPRYQVKRLHVRPGGKLSMQMHHHRSEHWVVVRGTAKVTIGGREQLLSENESAYIVATEWHRLENPGKIDLELIEVQTGSYLGEDDIVRSDDIYGRA